MAILVAGKGAIDCGETDCGAMSACAVIGTCVAT